MTKQKTFRPMLAEAVDNREDIIFPVFASQKIDGVRAVVKDGKLLSRKLIEIPNNYVQQMFGREEFNGLDGELIIEKTKQNTFVETQSAVMTEEGTPVINFVTFDDFSEPDQPFEKRLQRLKKRMSQYDHRRMFHLEQLLVTNLEQLEQFEAGILREGGEGVMIRSPNGLYKFNRSTLSEGYLLKLKRFMDSEAEIISVEEQMKNINAAEKDERGLTKRSSAKAGKVPAGRLGSLNVRDIYSGIEFSLGSGFTAEQRQMYWNDKEQIVGKIVKYKFFEAASKGAPRFPVFIGFRSLIDL